MYLQFTETIKIKHSILIMLFSLLSINSTYSQETSQNNGFNWDRVIIGGNLGAQFGNITIVEISPNVGYMVTEHLLTGIGGTYIYYKENFPGYNYSTSIYGSRVFSSYFFLENFIAHVEYEVLNLDNFLASSTDNERVTIGSLLVGGGYRSSLGGNSFASIMILYNLNESLHTPYSNPIIRIGFGIGL